MGWLFLGIILVILIVVALWDDATTYNGDGPLDD